MRADIHVGDCRDVLAAMADASVHAVVCDPPYELNFMNRAWDRRGIAFDPALWREILRVLRPGGHLVAFGGTRTHHRMYCAIEDAGFEIRDSLMYLYGSGFPKSLDVSKAIDKAAGLSRPRVAGGAGNGPATFSGYKSGEAISGEAISGEAITWNGWGTALKPAYEPICLARKPPSESSVAKNVLRWGTGAINIDGCRIAFESEQDKNAAAAAAQRACQDQNKDRRAYGQFTNGAASIEPYIARLDSGRWPANVCLDEEAAAMLDEQGGERTSGQPCGLRGATTGKGLGYGSTSTADTALTGCGDTGGASRFFFTAKPSVAEREDGLAHVAPHTRNRVNAGGLENDPKWAPTTRRNTHPTVKPFDLMSWLVRLVTPPGGIVCDPFLGSGSTGMAAVAEGFDFIGIEQDAQFAEIAEGRIRNVAPLLVTTEIHSTAEPGSLSGSVAAGSVTGPKPGTAGVRSNR